jgi:16S rRNA (guanine527-N7)-methyltransferase
VDAGALAAGAKTIGLSLTATQIEALALFERRLYEANAVMNLTRVPQAECWTRHFLDSLVLSPYIPTGSTVLDIGSGPGLPGAVLALARPDLRVTCLDSGGKPVRFMSGLFGPEGPLPVLFQVLQLRAEDAAIDGKYRERYDVVTGRAIAPFPVQAEISAPFASVGGSFLPLRTPAERDEIVRFPASQLGLALTDLKVVRVPGIGADRLIPAFTKRGRTPKEFPRTWSAIKANPIQA